MLLARLGWTLCAATDTFTDADNRPIRYRTGPHAMDAPTLTNNAGLGSLLFATRAKRPRPSMTTTTNSLRFSHRRCANALPDIHRWVSRTRASGQLEPVISPAANAIRDTGQD
jgi:hypothetical protein